MAGASSAGTAGVPPLQRLGVALGDYLHARTARLLDQAEAKLNECAASSKGTASRSDESPAAAAAETGLGDLAAGKSLPTVALRSAGAAAAARARSMLGPDVSGPRKALNVLLLTLAALLTLVALLLATVLVGLAVLVHLLVRP